MTVTLANTCHASNRPMMQDLVEATHTAITKAIWIAMFQLFHYWIGIKLNLILKLSSDAQRINLTFVAYSFVANFVRYISDKYYLNWFSFPTVIMKVLGVNFFETLCSKKTWLPDNCIPVLCILKQTVDASNFTTIVRKFTQRPCTISFWQIEILNQNLIFLWNFHDFV